MIVVVLLLDVSLLGNATVICFINFMFYCDYSARLLGHISTIYVILVCHSSFWKQQVGFLCFAHQCIWQKQAGFYEVWAYRLYRQRLIMSIILKNGKGETCARSSDNFFKFILLFEYQLSWSSVDSGVKRMPCFVL